MDAVTISACGGRNWDWPCLHLEGGDVVDLDISWLQDDDSIYPLPDTEGETLTSLKLYYRPVTGRASASNTGSVDATSSSNHILVSEFNPISLRGVYDAAVRWIDENAKIRLTLNCILSVEADRFSDTRLKSAVTINDLRMFLYDRLASENRAEEDQEFPDRTLFDGIVAAVRAWTDASSTYAPTAQTFTDRNMLLVGAAAWVLKSYRTLLARNATKSGGQTSIEADRIQMYSAMASEYNRIFYKWLGEQIRMDDANSSFLLV